MVLNPWFGAELGAAIISREHRSAIMISHGVVLYSIVCFNVVAAVVPLFVFVFSSMFLLFGVQYSTVSEGWGGKKRDRTSSGVTFFRGKVRYGLEAGHAVLWRAATLEHIWDLLASLRSWLDVRFNWVRCFVNEVDKREEFLSAQ